MKKHTKIYMEFFGFDIPEDVFSVMSGLPAQDVHHLKFKKAGGSKLLDFEENLCALTRSEHDRCHNDKYYNYQVQIKHLEYIRLKRPDYEMRPEYVELLKQHYLNQER